METSQCDALVFFGATGDLAYKKIFPALYHMTRRGHLEMPVMSFELFRRIAHDAISTPDLVPDERSTPVTTTAHP